MKGKFCEGIFCLVFGFVWFSTLLSEVFVAIPVSYGFPVGCIRAEFPKLLVKLVFSRHAPRMTHLLTKLN